MNNVEQLQSRLQHEKLVFVSNASNLELMQAVEQGFLTEDETIELLKGVVQLEDEQKKPYTFVSSISYFTVAQPGDYECQCICSSTGQVTEVKVMRIS